MTGEQEYKYVECYLAFIDIWGFKALVRKSQDDPVLLEALVRALNHAANTPGAYHSKATRDNDGKKVGEYEHLVQVRAFSDCVAIFIPVASKGLSSVLSSVRYIHDRMIELDCVLRGAVTIGGMYYEDSWSNPIPEQFKEARTAVERVLNVMPQGHNVATEDSDILFDINKLGWPITLGPAIVEAYRLESEEALYPRVIISEGLLGHIAERPDVNKKCFSLVSPCPEMQSKMLTDFIRTDSDGHRYFDLLHQDIYRKDCNRIVREVLGDGQVHVRWERGNYDHDDFLAGVRATIKKKLEEGVCMSKYEWLRDYYNEKCDDDMKMN